MEAADLVVALVGAVGLVEGFRGVTAISQGVSRQREIRRSLSDSTKLKHRLTLVFAKGTAVLLLLLASLVERRNSLALVIDEHSDVRA